MQNWMYRGEELSGEFDIKGLEGFVYLIENTISKRKYIGKKHFWTRRKNSKGKRVTKESDWRIYCGSCEELTKDIRDLGVENFSREILFFCKFKKEMSFYEESEQWKRNVLLTDDYYNTNIAGRFFVRERHIYQAREKQVTDKNDEWRKRKSEYMSGDGNPSKRPEVREKLRGKNPKKASGTGMIWIHKDDDRKRIFPEELESWIDRGYEKGADFHWLKTDEAITKRAESNKGKKRTEETRIKIREVANNREKFECPHCLKFFRRCHLMRYHNDKCKLKQ